MRAGATYRCRPDVVVRCRPLEAPRPAWCDEHQDDCALEQQHALSYEVDRDGDERPLEVVTARGHQ